MKKSFKYTCEFAAFLVLAFAATTIASAASRAADERLTLDWLFSEEGKTAMSVPHHAWLASGTLLVYDERPPMAERTLESVDPESGRRQKLVKPAPLIAHMNSLLEPGDPIEELGWPDAVDPLGRYVVYEHSDNIVLLDLRRSEIVPVAVTDAEEKSARFSPDGQWLAFVRANDLYVRNLADGSEKRLTEGATDTLMNGTVSWVYWEELLNRKDQGYFWAPDSSAIAYLQTDDAPVGVMHFVDIKPALPGVKRQRHPKAGAANPRVRAGVVRLADARTTWLDMGAYPHEYLARLQWLPDSQRLALETLDRAQTTLDIFIADATSGRAMHLLREQDPAWINVHDDLWFLHDGKRFVWLSERDGHAHLYMYDMRGELQQQITRGDWALKPSGGAAGMDRAVSWIDEAGGWIYFTALQKSSTERQLYRIRFDGSGQQRISAEDGTHVIDFGPDGKHYLDEWSTRNRPPSLVVHERGGAATVTVADAATAVTGRFGLQSWEMLTIKARDGYPMPAMMLKPRLFDAERRYPAVVYVYGGPSAPTVVDNWANGPRRLYHQVLADSGVVVFYVDNRSAAGRSKTDAATIVRNLYGQVELRDLLDGVAWLKTQAFIDADRVGVWGWSGGGTMTLQSMTSSDVFAAGVAVAPVTDWHYYDTIYTERYMKRPQDNVSGYAETSNVARAGDLHGRLLLVHGTYDDNVHPQNTWRFSDELIGHGITYDMMIYPMRKHGIKDDEAQAHLYQTMLEFWQRNFDLQD